MEGELFADIYLIGCLVFAVHRLYSNYSLKVNPASNLRSFFSITLLAITSLLVSPFWIFISWGISKTDEDSRKSPKLLMGTILILSVLNSCSLEEVNVTEARKIIDEKKLSFEKIPETDLENINIAALELDELINQAGVYGFVHKTILGVFLGTSKYKNIYDETAAEWRKSQKNDDVISPAEKELKRQVNVIPAENYQANADGYRRLSNINPSNETYESKYNEYSKKASEQRDRSLAIEAETSCRSSQKAQAGRSCGVNPIDTYCGIVYMDRIIGSGCKSKVRNSGNPYQFCVDEVSKVLIEQGC